MTQMLAVLSRSVELMVVQRRELAELFGIETRNKYSIEADGVPVAFAAEQGKSVGALLLRMLFGHFRRFEIHFFDAARALTFRAIHPFRFIFQRIEVLDASDRPIGAIQQRFALLSKRFDVVDPGGRVLLRVASPLWKPWTFAFTRDGAELARVEKKWSGLLAESFTDGDRFRVVYASWELGLDERVLVLAASIFVDLMYFEAKAG